MNPSAQKANAHPRLPGNRPFPSSRVAALAGLLGLLALLLILGQANLTFLFNSESSPEPQVMANLMSNNSRSTKWELIHKESFAHSAGVDSIVFNDSDNGWALTWATLFKLSDKGETWTPVLTNDDPSRAYYGIHFVNANVGFVVGAQKFGDLYTVLILQTSDGGKSWEDRPVTVRGDQEIHKAPALYGVSFCGEKSGWAVGGDLILHTTDGGNSWQSQEFDVDGKERLLTVTCVSPERAWTAGSGGLVLQTYDGGQTWTKQDVATKATLTEIRFFGNDGWMVAGGSAKGLLIKTSDHGKTWQPRQLDISGGFFDIFFLGSQGWLAGENGTLLRTTDAGKTWVRQPTPTNENLTSLFFLSPNEGWIGGDKLTLLRLENPGTTPAIESESIAARTTEPLPLSGEVSSDSSHAKWPLRVGQTFKKSDHRRTASFSTQPANKRVSDARVERVNSSTDQEPAVLDLCELVGNWQKYNREKVRVRAIMRVGAEQTWLSDPACRNGEALTDVNFQQHPTGAMMRLDQIIARDRQARVILEGTFHGAELNQNVDPKLPARLRELFEKSPRRYGHMGSFETQIEVTKVVEATEVTKDSSTQKR
jgi:photosystem II stability/assembly factor-like uncharacterized protein